MPFWSRLLTIALLVALGLLLGAGLRRGALRGAAALCLGLVPALCIAAGSTLLTGAALGAVVSTALFAGVPLGVVAGHAALGDGREPLMARTGFVLSVVQALILAAATFAGILTDAMA
jgi:hypothetical protein